MKLEQSGDADIAWYHGEKQQYVPVAIKKRQRPKELLTEIRSHSNACVVQLLDTKLTKSNLYLIYEYMDVSLRHLYSIPKKMFTSHEIGAVCREVCLSNIDIIYTDFVFRFWKGLTLFILHFE